MKLRVLGGGGGETATDQTTCVLLNERIALDAGCLTQSLSLAEQARVGDVILTHAHMDHIASLPFLVDNMFDRTDEPLRIFASEPTIAALRAHLFNGTIWPDFSRMTRGGEPVLRFETIEAEKPFVVRGLRFTPIAVDHQIPTLGMLIEEGDVAVLWSSDTGQTDRLWEIANAAPHLQAICVDVSFDNSLQSVAVASGHMTPNDLAADLEKLDRDVPIYLQHLKPSCVDQVKKEIRALGRANIDFLEDGRTYEFTASVGPVGRSLVG